MKIRSIKLRLCNSYKLCINLRIKKYSYAKNTKFLMQITLH